jgi:hypothetical protein
MKAVNAGSKALTSVRTEGAVDQITTRRVADVRRSTVDP